MKDCTPEERNAELQRAKESQLQWARKARIWDYADLSAIVQDADKDVAATWVSGHQRAAARCNGNEWLGRGTGDQFYKAVPLLHWKVQPAE